MRLKVITTVSSIDNPGLKKLEHSLRHFNYDYKILHNPNIGWDWGGWDTHYKWLCSDEAKEYTHVIYTDGFDTLALGGQDECEKALKKILEPNPDAFVYSTEKNFFPFEEYDNYLHSGRAEQYPSNFFTDANLGLTPNHRWRYVNGGQYAGSIEAVKHWYETVDKSRNNQYYANKYFVTSNDKKDLILDFGCDLFQTVAFTAWNYGDRVMFPAGYLDPNTIDLATFPGLDEFEQVEIGGQKRIRNKILDKLPPLLHGNGRCDMQFVYDCLNL